MTEPLVGLEKISIPQSKKPWQSKTLWLALASAVVPFVPGAKEWVAGNSELYGVIVGGVFSVLRLVTKGQVSIQ